MQVVQSAFLCNQQNCDCFCFRKLRPNGERNQVLDAFVLSVFDATGYVYCDADTKEVYSAIKLTNCCREADEMGYA